MTVTTEEDEERTFYFEISSFFYDEG